MKKEKKRGKKKRKKRKKSNHAVTFVCCWKNKKKWRNDKKCKQQRRKEERKEQRHHHNSSWVLYEGGNFHSLRMRSMPGSNFGTNATGTWKLLSSSTPPACAISARMASGSVQRPCTTKPLTAPACTSSLRCAAAHTRSGHGASRPSRPAAVVPSHTWSYAATEGSPRRSAAVPSSCHHHARTRSMNERGGFTSSNGTTSTVAPPPRRPSASFSATLFASPLVSKYTMAMRGSADARTA